MKIVFLGSGSWATALSNVLSDNGHEVFLWARNPADAEKFQTLHENTKYLPGISLNENIVFSSSGKSLLKGANVVVLATGAQSTREVLKDFKDFIPEDAILLNISKGIEIGTFSLMSEVAKKILKDNPYCVLSGPSFASEVAMRMPTAVVSASKDKDIAKTIQNLFMNDYFRVYTSSDVIGVELGGSLKNIIALGTGMIEGLGMGKNVTAAFMTRGLYEMMKMGKKLGADIRTFSGLSGVGDLFLTATSNKSRNYRAGFLIGTGKTKEEAQKEIGMLVEGISTTKSVYFYSVENDVEMPISQEMYQVLYGDLKVSESAIRLMTRSGKNEMEIFQDF